MSIYEYDEKKQRRLDREEGREEGQELLLIKLIQKKIIKNKTIETIADELETTIDEIKPIYDAVRKAPTDAEPMDIYTEYL